MGTESSQALTLICDYESAKFYIVSISVEELAVLDVPADLEWAMIVAYHRGRMEKIKGTSFYSKYQEMTEDKDLVILPFPFLILSVVMLLIEPICYVFSKKEISFIYFYGRRLIVSWQNVQAVERWYSYKLFSLDSVYRIHYGVVFRGRYVRQFASMLATPKLKDCFRKYYVGTISGEGERVARTKKGRKRRN